MISDHRVNRLTEKSHTHWWWNTQQEKVFWTWQFYHHETLTWKSLRMVLKTQTTSLRYSLTSLLCQTTFSLSRANLMPYCHWLGMEISWMPRYCHSRIASFLMTQWVWCLIMGVLGVWFWYSMNFLADEFCPLMSLPPEIPPTCAVCNFLFCTLHNGVMPAALAFQ